MGMVAGVLDMYVCMPGTLQVPSTSSVVMTSMEKLDMIILVSQSLSLMMAMY
jgi:hypothetical protein